MKSSRTYTIILLVLLLTCTCAYGVQSIARNAADAIEVKTPNENVVGGSVSIAQTTGIDEAGLSDSQAVYTSYSMFNLKYMYITVRRGTSGTKTDHSFAEVNAAIRSVDTVSVENDVSAEALVQVGNEFGPTAEGFGYGETINNATLRTRGSSSSLSPQPSYNIKLNDNAGLLDGQSTILINKHAYDASRVRNKLFFDLQMLVDNMTSLRTQFYVVYIQDETAGSNTFVNAGLYTQVESINKTYLKNHGLDSAGYLYKAVSFNFEPNELLKNIDEEGYNEDQFNSILQIKGRNEHTKLINLINEINDPVNDIDDTINQYLDRENYITWLAYNILMGNNDTTMHNFYLYSPLNSEKWYFINWDGDGCLLNFENQQMGLNTDNWKYGICNFWGVSLHQKFLMVEENRNQLKKKMDELRTILTKEQINAHLDEYGKLVYTIPDTMPDVGHLPVFIETRKQIWESMALEVDTNYAYFTKSLEDLMPFWLFSDVGEQRITFSWADAYDFQGQMITYKLIVSSNSDFSLPIYSVDNIQNLSYEIPKLSAGIYYWTVIATSEDGRTVSAFNAVRNEAGDMCVSTNKMVIS